MKHICTPDDRGLCETCETKKRADENHAQLYKNLANIMRTDRIPYEFEWPTPYEFGKMENGEWD